MSIRLTSRMSRHKIGVLVALTGGGCPHLVRRIRIVPGKWVRFQFAGTPRPVGVRRNDARSVEEERCWRDRVCGCRFLCGRRRNPEVVCLWRRVGRRMPWRLWIRYCYRRFPRILSFLSGCRSHEDCVISRPKWTCVVFVCRGLSLRSCRADLRESR